jgi:hypothetical protein
MKYFLSTSGIAICNMQYAFNDIEESKSDSRKSLLCVEIIILLT